MKRFLSAVFFLVISVFPQPVRADSIQSSETYAGYLALPEARSGPLPVIVLIHEWWGLNSEMRARADRFASKGFAALAVDLFSAQTTSNPMEAYALSQGLTEERAMEDLQGVLSYLEKNPEIDSKKIGAIGWGMGAKLALQLAARDERVKAAALFYSVPEIYEKVLPDLKVPVFGAFGVQEKGVSEETIRRFKFRLERLEKRATIFIYEDAGYSFATPEDPSYQEKAAAESWRNVFVFFKQNLS